MGNTKQMKDLFSHHAATYAGFRPEYPEALYDFVLENVPHRDAAWDCATGNGQAAKVLCRYFREVRATDISQNQLDHAFRGADNIHYSRLPAEKTDFPDGFFDLITVAQALHWFDFGAFFSEANRVAKPGAVLAAWGYETLHFDHPELEKLMSQFYHYTTNPYWEPERRHIENRYAHVPFPFDPVPCPRFEIVVKWHRHEFEGYLNSWSAVQKCIRTEGFNPVSGFMIDVGAFWGEMERQLIRFPVFLKMGVLKGGSNTQSENPT